MLRLTKPEKATTATHGLFLNYMMIAGVINQQGYYFQIWRAKKAPEKFIWSFFITGAEGQNRTADTGIFRSISSKSKISVISIS
jgi:hypothetical protein